MLKSGTELLMIPGPTTLPGAVVQALSRPATDIYHGPLHDVSLDCLQGLSELFGTRERPYIFTANGHGGWEAALCNTLSRGDRVLALETGLLHLIGLRPRRRLGSASRFFRGVGGVRSTAKLWQSGFGRIPQAVSALSLLLKSTPRPVS